MASAPLEDCLLSRKIFVGNISQTIPGYHKLKKFFRKFGKVESAHLVYDRQTGQFKMIGFVTFEKPEAALKALAAKDDQLTFMNRVLRVSSAEKKKLEQTVEQIHRNRTKDFSIQLSETEENDSSTAFPLNADCLLYVFNFLSLRQRILCERVSKYWRAVSLKSWKTVVDINFGEIVNGNCNSLKDDMVIQVLQRASDVVKVIDLTFCRQVTDKLPMILCQCVPRLTELNLSKTRRIFSPMVGEIIGRNAQHLKVLNLAECDGLSEASLIRLFQHNPHIEELDLSCLPFSVTGDSLTMCTHLRKLNISKALFMSNGTLEKILESCSETIEELDVSYICHLRRFKVIKQTPNLKKLNISYCKLTERHVSEFTLSGAFNLEELIAMKSHILTDQPQNFKLLVKHCPKIKKLNLSRNIDVDQWGPRGAFLRPISDLSNLVRLDLSYLRAYVDLVNFQSFSNLECLILCGSKAILSMPDFVFFVGCLPSLTYLDISGMQLQEIVGKDAKRLLQELTDLSHRRTDLCHGQTLPNLKLVVGGCGLQSLEGIEKIGRYTIDMSDNSIDILYRTPDDSPLYTSSSESSGAEDD